MDKEQSGVEVEAFTALIPIHDVKVACPKSKGLRNTVESPLSCRVPRGVRSAPTTRTIPLEIAEGRTCQYLRWRRPDGCHGPPRRAAA
jgi:hypothetical protein